jgi:hypothetical protein
MEKKKPAPASPHARVKATNAKGLHKRPLPTMPRAGFVQPKSATPTKAAGMPAAPPVYRPQPTPKVLQRKAALVQTPSGVLAKRAPVAPPVYRPKQAPAPVQAKMAQQGQPSSAGGTPRRPVAPPVYHPQQKKTVQPKMGAPAQARKAAKTQPVYRPEAGPLRPHPPSSMRAVMQMKPNRPSAATFKARPTVSPATSVRTKAAGVVLQPMMAYRVGTSKSKYKVEIDEDKGTIKDIKGGASGIDISFGSRDHASYYFATKKSDEESVLDEWDLPDKLYTLIVYRMNHPAHKSCPAGGNAAIWNEIKNLPAPTNSSDQVVRENNLIAPHFQLAWIPILSKYCKGQKVKRTTVAEEFPAEEEAPSVVAATPGDDDNVEVYIPADGADAEEVEGTMTYAEFRKDYGGGGYAYRTV